MTEPQTRLVSCYAASATAPTTKRPEAKTEKPLYDVLASMRISRPLAEQVAAVRALEYGSPEQDDAKDRLPAITPSANFGRQRRTDDADWKHTGAIVMDFDGLDDPAAFRDACATVTPPGGRSTCTVAAFVSPRGNGVKVLAHVTPLPKCIEDHWAAFAAVCTLYTEVLGVAPDTTQMNPGRICFLSSDPDAVLLPAGQTWGLRWKDK